MYLPHMGDMPLSAALDAFDAMIGAITIDDTNPVPIELDSIQDNGDAMVGAAIVADGAIEGSAIEVEGTIGAAISIEQNLATGIGPTISTEAITSTIPDSAIGDVPIAAHGPSADGAITVAQSMVVTTGTSSVPLEASISSENTITDEPTTTRFKRPRPFYGPNIEPDTAFTASGTIQRGEVAEDAASMKSVASTIKKRASPKRGGGDSASKRGRPINSTPMAPLPVVKPKDYEEWLQAHLNAHPTIGLTKLFEALENLWTSLVRDTQCGRGSIATRLSWRSRILLITKSSYRSNLH